MPLPPRDAARARARRWLPALLFVALASCASFEQDLHLSPAFSNLSTAGGGREIEALAGAVRVRYPEHDGDWSQSSLRPLASRSRYSNGDSLNRFLVPLGTRSNYHDERTTQLLPVFRYQSSFDEQGEKSWKFLALPGILWSQDDSGRIVRAFFPFGGVIEGSFTYDRIDFALFPLFARTLRDGRASYHFLIPIFAWSTKQGERPSWRIWPLYGVTRSEHRDNHFFLWPLFHWHKTRGTFEPESQVKKWMLFPLVGRAQRGTFVSYSVLWPFFGWSSNPATGFWGWDGPWPLLRIQRPGSQTDVPYRTRLWPFYSYYNGDGLESTWVLWPFFNWRTETNSNSRRKGQVVVPFWQRWRQTDDNANEIASWAKLWPLVQVYTRRDEGRLAFPALNPLWHTPVVDDHYAFIYELYTREWSADRVRQRAWGGIWRRDVDPFERRTYLTGLYGRRHYREEDEDVSETSLLLGILRWRSRNGRFEGLLPPALPGPGFPMARRASERIGGRP